MFRKFKALTMAEMLITMGIIGFISVIALTTIKPYDKTYKWLYVKIYHSLEEAVYNAMMTRDSFPATTTAFCNMLGEFINMAENNCDTAPDLSIDASAFPEDSIKFIATNGMRFWIGSDGGKPYLHTRTTIDGSPANMKYYVVFVDINGSKAPNLAQQADIGNLNWSASNRLVDIVAFVVTEASVVIPVGPPEIDTRYMQAYAIYPPNDPNMPEGNRSAPLTYYAAKNEALGTTRSLAEPMTFDFYRDFPANSPFAITYPAAAAISSECRPASSDEVPPCYVKVEAYNN